MSEKRHFHCHCPAIYCHFANGPCHVVASSLHDVTLVGHHSIFYSVFFIFYFWVILWPRLFCWGWQLSSSEFFWLWY